MKLINQDISILNNTYSTGFVYFKIQVADSETEVLAILIYCYVSSFNANLAYNLIV